MDIKKPFLVVGILLLPLAVYASITLTDLISSLKIKTHTYNGSVVEHQGKLGIVARIGAPGVLPEECFLLFPQDWVAKVQANIGADGWATGADLMATLNIPESEVDPLCFDVYRTVAFAGAPVSIVYDTINQQFINGTVGVDCDQPVVGWGDGWYTLKSDPNLYAYCGKVVP